MTAKGPEMPASPEKQATPRFIEPEANRAVDVAADTSTRRHFLHDVGRKSRYVVPVVLSLSLTQRAHASGASGVS